MQNVGMVEEIWRYPISSVDGERLASTELLSDGIPFDRKWALVDADTGKPAAPETEVKWRPALFLRARVQDSRTEIGFPDGQWLAPGAENLQVRLSDHFGFSVELRQYGTDNIGISHFATAKNRYAPSPVHLLTTASMETLAATGVADIAIRRFRPTILIRIGGEGFPESGWLGQSVQIGPAELFVREEAKRCGMTMVAQPGLPENPDILRAIVRQNRRNLGIYCDVTRIGMVNIGDRVFLNPDGG